MQTPRKKSGNDHKVIPLNVGGTTYTTSLHTLTRFPNSLLCKLFTGNLESIPKDGEGRYFLDLDGHVFAHILSYLRTDQLPPRDVAEVVHRDSVLLGLDDLATTLEQTPPVLQKMCREHTQSAIPGYTKFMTALFDWIKDDCRCNITGNSMFYISLFRQSQDKSEPIARTLKDTFDIKHICHGFRKVGKEFQKVNADLYFGPWDHEIYASEDEMMTFIVKDVMLKGFDVAGYEAIGDACEYKCVSGGALTRCQKKVFYIHIRWWDNIGPFK